MQKFYFLIMSFTDTIIIEVLTTLFLHFVLMSHSNVFVDDFTSFFGDIAATALAFGRASLPIEHGEKTMDMKACISMEEVTTFGVSSFYVYIYNDISFFSFRLLLVNLNVHVALILFNYLLLNFILLSQSKKT